MAVQLFESGYEEELKNQIQFSWFIFLSKFFCNFSVFIDSLKRYGAEEAGLLGSNFFVSDLIENDPGFHFFS